MSFFTVSFSRFAPSRFFTGDFKRENGPLWHSGQQPSKVRKRPMKANGLLSGTPPWWNTAPLKRPIKRSMIRKRGSTSEFLRLATEGVSETGSAKAASGTDVRIDDVGSILNFCIGFSLKGLAT